MNRQSPHHHAALLTAAAWFFTQQQSATAQRGDASPWAGLASWRLCGDNHTHLRLSLNDELCELDLTPTADGFHWRQGEQQGRFSFSEFEEQFVWQDDDGRVAFNVTIDHHGLQLTHEGFLWQCSLVEPWKHAKGADEGHAGYRAPMTGRITAVLVSAGQAVKKGEALVVMEAMKMEHRITAKDECVLSEVRVSAGDLVQDGQVLLAIE